MRKKVAFVCVILLLTATLAGSIFLLCKYRTEQKESGITIKNIGLTQAGVSTLHWRVESDVEVESVLSEPEQTPTHGTFAELSAQNEDYAGWVSIEETAIDYPVMSADPNDPEFYLTHDFEKKETEFGVPFLDARCSIDTDNLIVYGHHTRYGTMFSDLHEYQDKSFWAEHPTVTLELADGAHEFEIFAVMTAKGEYTDSGWSIFKCIDMSEAEFETMCAEVSARRLYDTKIMPQSGDRLLTLVTCEYSQENGRLVILTREQT